MGLAAAGVMGSVALLGCGRSATAEAPRNAQGEARRTALVAQPCSGLPIGSEALDPADARIFVEVAEVTTPGLPRPIGPWLEGRPVEVRSTAHLVAFPEVPTSTPWGLCVDAVCSSQRHSLTLTARLPKLASEPLQLALRIDAAEDGAEARQVLLDTALELKNQEPALLPPAPALNGGSLVVTAYLLRRHDDLHRILECTAGQGGQR